MMQHDMTDAVDFFDDIVWSTEDLIYLYLDIGSAAPVDLHVALVERGVDVYCL